MTKRAIIIDDERLARTELRKLLLDFPEIEVVEEATNVEEGLDKIDQFKAFYKEMAEADDQQLAMK